jgi:hypothetical protein
VPKCRRQIHAIRKIISICVCGYDWRGIDPTRVAKVKFGISANLRVVRKPSNEVSSNNPLSTLALTDFIIAVTFAARCQRKRSKGLAKHQPNDGKLNTCLKREFGSLYECVYQDLDGSQFDFLRHAFCEFLTNRIHSPPAMPVEKLSRFASSESETHTSLADARRSLKITNAALFDLIAAGEIR